ncbi:Vgr family protein, partial [Flavobacterium psychrophilum]|nr:Vgr family protein [Flavobacterium psychrophilum]
MIQEKIIFGIDKKEVSHFTSLEITQTINQHHQFRISVPHSVIEQPRAFTIDNAQDWLGKVVHIALEKKNNFLGIVTNIQYAQELGHVGSQIILSGYSKTILLESGQKLHSWEDTTLQDMVREIIKTAANEQLQNDIKPEYTTKIDYQTQYLESDFSYIQR